MENDLLYVSLDKYYKDKDNLNIYWNIQKESTLHLVLRLR